MSLGAAAESGFSLVMSKARNLYTWRAPATVGWLPARSKSYPLLRGAVCRTSLVERNFG